MSWFTTVEADVVSFIQKCETEVQWTEKEAKAAITWVANQTPSLAQNIALVAQFIGQVPIVGTNPEVLAAVSAANLAMQGLNIIAQNVKAATTTGPTAAQVATSYAAFNDVKAATRQAMSVAVKKTSTANK